MQNSKMRYSRTFIIAAILTLVGAFAWRMGTYFFMDDLIYRHVAGGDDMMYFWYCKGRFIETFADAVESIKAHYMTVNGRLANIIAILFMLIPRWLVNVFDSIMLFVMFMSMMWASKRSYFHYGTVQTIIGVLLFWITFQWYDNMESNVFIVNYVWTSVCAFPVIKFFMHSNRLTRWQLTFTTLLAIVVAWMHEGFACVMIAYSFFYWLMGNKRCRKSRFVIGTGLIIGLVAAMSLGTIERIGCEYVPFEFSLLKHFVTRYTSQLWPVWVSIILVVYFRVKIGAKRFKAYIPMITATYAAVLVNVIMGVMLVALTRVFWLLDIYVIILVMAIMDALVKPAKAPSTIAKIGVAICLCAYGIWLSQLARWQWQFGKEEEDLEQLARNAKAPILYYDLTDDRDVPSYLLRMVSHSGQDFLFQSTAISKSYIGAPGLIVLPTKYQNVPLDQIKYPGQAGMLGVWPTLYSYDGSYEYIDLTVGKPMASVSWIDRIIMSFGPEVVTHRFSVKGRKVCDFEGKPIYVYYTEPIGRSIAGREVLSID